MSNTCRWLIHYHREKGNLERAREIADHNAEVYSAWGLVSALALALDLKERERARELAEALADRYDENDYRGLVSWVIDGREDTPVLKRIFPDGFRKVTLEEMEEGKVNKGLRRLRLAAPSAPGAIVRAGDKDVGRLTTAATSPLYGPIAMAYVPPSQAAPESERCFSFESGMAPRVGLEPGTNRLTGFVSCG